MQAPSILDQRRKTRWAVIRNTQPELRTTTIKTWEDWFPEKDFGKINMQPPFTHHIQVSELDMEVIFLALDKAEDVKKLLSLELTGAWINEAREISKAVVDGLTSRVGRYPSVRDGGPTWNGIIMDTNPPDEDHWWPIVAGDVPPPDYLSEDELRMLVKPHNWRFFSQPAAMKPVKAGDGKLVGYEMNTDRENQGAIPATYYQNMLTGKTPNWINVYVCNQYGSLTDGKAIYPQFDRNLHVASQPIAPIPGIPVVIGIDFGLTPSAVFAQNFRGLWMVLRELVATDMGIARFSKVLRNEMASMPGATYQVWGDPAGDQRAQTDEDTPFRVLRNSGITAMPTHSNDVALRIEAVVAPLSRLIEKKPGMIVDPRCKVLIKGFEGGYHYRRLNVSGERYEEVPNKNRFSHPHDALQYAMLGGGEGRKLLRPANEAKATNAKRGWNVFDRPTVRQAVRRLKGW